MANNTTKIGFPKNETELEKYYADPNVTFNKSKGIWERTSTPSATSTKGDLLKTINDAKKQINTLTKKTKTLKVKQQIDKVQVELAEKQRQLAEIRDLGLDDKDPVPDYVKDVAKETVVDSDVSEELASDPYYQQLDANSKAIVSYYESILESDDAERQQAFSDAMDAAAEQADPYWAEQLRIVKDEFTRTVGGLEQDFAAMEADLMARSKAIGEDLEFNKEFISAEEQAALSKQKLSYDVQLDGMREDAAQRGITSSSIKNIARERLDESNIGVVESITRQSARLIREETVGAERGLGDIERLTEDARAKLRATKTGEVRGLESIIGTTDTLGVKGTSGFTLGGVTGSFGETKTKDILQRAQALIL